MKRAVQALVESILLIGLGGMTVSAGAVPAKVPIWPKLQASLFGTQPIAPADGLIELDVPARAEDAAIVPVAVHTAIPQSANEYIERIYLVIDNNPGPVAAVFEFTRDSGRADIETRVRVEEYTTIRAIAQTNTGKLYMASRDIKASGGCSAPAGKDLDAALANLGRTRMNVEGPVITGRPALAQIMISHPNTSGLAMDQVTRLYAPPHFVRKLTVSYQGRKIMSADLDFAISENPNFRFYFVPERSGTLKAEIVDSQDLEFTNQLQVSPKATE